MERARHHGVEQSVDHHGHPGDAGQLEGDDLEPEEEGLDALVPQWQGRRGGSRR